ncbi:MAG: formate dehydrogenase, partial [Rhabdaerophilum sp.]
MLIKRKEGQAARQGLAAALAATGAERLDRRAFLRRSGLAAGGLAAVGSIGFGSVREARAKMPVAGKPVEMKKNMCTHCSVGCTVKAEVQEGVWVGQEPAWESPINR